MQLVWYSLALSATNTYCTYRNLPERKSNSAADIKLPPLLLSTVLTEKYHKYRHKADCRYGKATQCWAALGICKTFVTESIHKRGGKPPSLMRFPFLHSPQGEGLYSLTVRAQGTSSTRAHSIKCHFGPNFTLWPTLPRQRKQNARCSLCLLPQQHFIHCSKKLPGIHSKPSTPSLVCPVTGQSAGLSSAHFWCLPIISQPSLLLSPFLLPKPAGIWTLNGRPPWQQ